MQTDRHDACPSLYWRSRRKLPTRRPSWPGTEAQVPPRCSRRRGCSVALDPLARPVRNRRDPHDGRELRRAAPGHWLPLRATRSGEASGQPAPLRRRSRKSLSNVFAPKRPKRRERYRGYRATAGCDRARSKNALVSRSGSSRALTRRQPSRHVSRHARNEPTAVRSGWAGPGARRRYRRITGPRAGSGHGLRRARRIVVPRRRRWLPRVTPDLFRGPEPPAPSSPGFPRIVVRGRPGPRNKSGVTALGSVMVQAFCRPSVRNPGQASEGRVRANRGRMRFPGESRQARTAVPTNSPSPSVWPGRVRVTGRADRFVPPILRPSRTQEPIP